MENWAGGMKGLKKSSNSMCFLYILKLFCRVVYLVILGGFKPNTIGQLNAIRISGGVGTTIGYPYNRLWA